MSYIGKGNVDGKAAAITINESGIRWESKGLLGMGGASGGVPRAQIAGATLTNNGMTATVEVETTGGKVVKITPKWGDRQALLDAANGF